MISVMARAKCHVLRIKNTVSTVFLSAVTFMCVPVLATPLGDRLKPTEVKAPAQVRGQDEHFLLDVKTDLQSRYSSSMNHSISPRQAGDNDVVVVDQIEKSNERFVRKFDSYDALISYASINLDVAPAQVANELKYALKESNFSQAERFEVRLLLAKTDIKQNLIEKTTRNVDQLHEYVETPQQRLEVFKLQFELATSKSDLALAVKTIDNALEFAQLSISEKATRQLEIERGNWHQRAAVLYLEYGQFTKAEQAIEHAIEVAKSLQQFGASIERRQLLARIASANDDKFIASLTHQRLVQDLESKSLFLLSNKQRIEWASLLINERKFSEADQLLEQAFQFGQSMRNRSVQLESLIVLIDSQLQQFKNEYARELLRALEKLQSLPNAFGFDITKQAFLKADIVRLKSIAALRMGQTDRSQRLIYGASPQTPEQSIQYALLKKQIASVQGQWQKADRYQKVSDFLIQQNKADMLKKQQDYLEFEYRRDDLHISEQLTGQAAIISQLKKAVISLSQRLSGALWLLIISLGVAAFFYFSRRPKPKY